MALDDISEYFNSYDKTTYEVCAQQGSEPRPRDIAKFESQIGFSLPDEFREFAVHPLGGLYMAVKEDLWPRPKEYEVGPFWSFLYGFIVYGLSKEVPEQLSMRVAWQQMVENGYPQYVPFLQVITDANPFCFTSDQKIVLWQHDEPDNPEKIDLTFSEVVMDQIHSLEERKERKLRGEDKQK